MGRTLAVMLIAVACASAGAITAPKEIFLPHGLAPRAPALHTTLQTHADVISAARASRGAPAGSPLKAAEAAACGRRLAHLRYLVAEGLHEEAIDASFALREHEWGEGHPTAIGEVASSGRRRLGAHADFLHADCAADAAHVGEASLATRVSTPFDRGTNPRAVPLHEAFIKLFADHADHADEADGAPSAVVLPVRLAGTSSRVPMSSGHARVPVVGFSLDGHFVLAESTLRCRHAHIPPAEGAGTGGGGGGLLCDGGASLRNAPAASAAEAFAELAPLLAAPSSGGGQRRQLGLSTFMGAPLIPSAQAGGEDGAPSTGFAGLPDAATTYAVGAKKVIAIPVLPSDGAESLVAPKGYYYGLIKSSYGGSIRSYVAAVMATADSFFQRNSFGKMSLTVTVTPVYSVNYLSTSCGSVDGLDFWASKSSLAMDMMAFAAAAALNPTTAFDFQVIFCPQCTALGYSGLGWVGVPGTLQNLYYANDLDASVAHELGHNLGANHASYMTGGTRRGRVAWEDNAASWLEHVETCKKHTCSNVYGNPHTTMGQGNINTGDFLVEGKSVFDWIGTTEIVEVTPFNGLGIGQCKPCGPYALAPTDTGSYPAGSKLGIQIYTGTANRFYFIEHRTLSTGGSAALVTWSDVASGGRTGYYGNSVLADCTPLTSSWTDAGCAAGQSIVLDVGTEATAGAREVTVYVAAGAGGTLSVSVAASLTMQPSVSPAPTPDTLAPTLDTCGSGNDPINGCCDAVTGTSGTFLGKVFTRKRDSCCSSYCSYEWNGYYLEFADGYSGGPYFITLSPTCITSGTLSYYAQYTVAEVNAMCNTPAPPVPAPTPRPTAQPTPRPTQRPTTQPTMQPTKHPIPFVETSLDCDFSVGFCSFTPSPTPTAFPFARISGTTPTASTGPIGDHTSGAGFYVYCETSNPNTGKPFNLNLAIGQPMQSVGVSFWYSNYGANAGTIRLQGSSDASTYSDIWTFSGATTQAWFHAAVPVTTAPSFLRFEYTSGGLKGDFALDDFAFVPQSSLLQPSPQPTPRPTSRPTAQPTPQPTQQPTPQPSMRPTAQPTKHPIVPGTTPRPTVKPSPRPSKNPVPRPTPKPTREPSRRPVAAPISAPTKRPVPSPTKRPVPRPTQLPAPAPTARDALTVDVGIILVTLQQTMSAAEEDNLKATIVATAGVDAADVTAFAVEVVALPARRRILSGYEWKVTFKIKTSLGATGGSASPAAFASSVAASLSASLALNLASAGLSFLQVSSVSAVAEARASPRPTVHPEPAPPPGPPPPEGGKGTGGGSAGDSGASASAGLGLFVVAGAGVCFVGACLCGARVALGRRDAARAQEKKSFNWQPPSDGRATVELATMRGRGVGLNPKLGTSFGRPVSAGRGGASDRMKIKSVPRTGLAGILSAAAPAGGASASQPNERRTSILSPFGQATMEEDEDEAPQAQAQYTAAQLEAAGYTPAQIADYFEAAQKAAAPATATAAAASANAYSAAAPADTAAPAAPAYTAPPATFSATKPATAAPAPAASSDLQACSAYGVDLAAAVFGTCKCGRPKAEHSQAAPAAGKSAAPAAGKYGKDGKPLPVAGKVVGAAPPSKTVAGIMGKYKSAVEDLNSPKAAATAPTAASAAATANPAAAATAAQPPPPAGPAPLPFGWQEVADPASGKSYYYNGATSVTTWERPVAVDTDRARPTSFLRKMKL